MSFILDALKKSETDRQRQSGPALYEVRVARPQRSLPPWAIAVVALLGVNLVVISWLLLHHSSSPPAAAPAAAAAAPAPAAAPGTPPPGYYAQAPQVAQPPQGQPPQGQYYAYPPQPGMQPAQGQPPYPPPPNQGGAYPQVGQSSQGGAYPPPNYPQQQAPYGQPPVPQGQVASNAVQGGGAVQEDSGNPDDEAPAVAPGPATGGSVRRGNVSGLPFYPDADGATAAGLPTLRMDFHSYGSTPQQRFVMINSHNLHEGQVSPEGIRVDEITPDGAAISKGPARYFLPRP